MSDGVNFPNPATSAAASYVAPASFVSRRDSAAASTPSMNADNVAGPSTGSGLYPRTLSESTANSDAAKPLTSRDNAFIGDAVARNLPMLTPSERLETAQNFAKLAEKLETADPATAKSLVQTARQQAIDESQAFGADPATAKGIGNAFDAIGKRFSARDEPLTQNDTSSVNAIADATIAPALANFSGADKAEKETQLREQLLKLAQTVKNASPAEAERLRDGAQAAPTSTDPFTEAGRQAALRILEKFSQPT